MNLYHLTFETDRETLAALNDYVDRVHAVAGYLWTSLSHGNGPSYLVIALPVGVAVDGLEMAPVSCVSGFEPTPELDPTAPTPAPQESQQDEAELIEETEDDPADAEQTARPW